MSRFHCLSLLFCLILIKDAYPQNKRRVQALKHIQTDIDSAFKYERTRPGHALEFAQKALKRSAGLSDQPDYTRCLIEVGNCNYMLGNNPEAYTHYVKALRQSNRFHDEESQGICYLLIAQMFLAEEDHQRALSFALKAQPFILQKQTKRDVILLYNTLGEAYLEIDRRLASENGAKAYSMAQVAGGDALLARCALTFGLIQLKFSDRQTGQSLLQYAATCAATCKDYHTLILTYEHLADFFRQSKHTDSVLIYAHRAMAFSRKSGYRLGEHFSTHLLEAWFHSKGLQDSVAKYASIEMNDTVSEKKNDEEIRRIDDQEQALEKEMAVYKEKLEEARKRNNRYLILYLICVFFLAGWALPLWIPKVKKFLGLLAFLLLFEIANLTVHALLASKTADNPLIMLPILVIVAMITIPIHEAVNEFIEHRKGRTFRVFVVEHFRKRFGPKRAKTNKAQRKSHAQDAKPSE